MTAVITVCALTVGVILFRLVYTPTITVRVDNDTASQVTLAGCSSDPATLDPGAGVELDPNPNDAHNACVVYRGNTRDVLGCLYVPTTRYHDHATIELSRYRKGVPASAC